jgi:hypothetical protein
LLRTRAACSRTFPSPGHLDNHSWLGISLGCLAGVMVASTGRNYSTRFFIDTTVGSRRRC